ncbi:MAG: hypothetical protein Q8K99_02055 [Actinomycetota bacterium]|nr:hypothetical protein [Actinomycetota bacterium]
MTMIMTKTTRISRLAPIAAAVAIALAAAPAVAGALGAAPASATVAVKFASRLEAKPAPVVKVAKSLTPVAVKAETAAVQTASPKAAAPAPVAPRMTLSATTVAGAAKASTSSASTPTKRSVAATDDLSEARAILAGLISQHPVLAGVTVSIGTTPDGHQAVAYYKSGRIVISPTHTASLSRILKHEIWHIIDWRDNGRIDWGENVPPRQ